jgi:AcrR family transcriptional regulator
MRVTLSIRHCYSQNVSSGHQPSPGPSQGPPPQARTRLARAAVIEAARSLFLERGYGATTIEAISALADVPAPTVYRLFSSKLGILKALLDVSIVGDQETVPMADRREIQALLADADARSMLAGFAKVTAQVNSRVAPLYRILVSAAGSDSDAAALLDELTDQRQAGQQLIARSLAGAGALRSELRERDAADVIHALLSPELYRLLVLDRHWKSERYERWLTSILADQLLPAEPARSIAAE